MQSITGFVGRGAMIDRDLKRRLVAAVDLVAQFGPAWSRHFANLYVVTPEGAVVMYWPGEPWALNASDWEVSGKLALIGKPNEPVLVTGPPADAPADRETWSELYFDYGVSDWLVSVTRPVLSQGRHVASVGHDLMLHDLIDRTVSSNLKGTYNFLVSEQGRLIAHPQFMEAIQARSGVLLVEETGDETLARLYRLALERESRRDDRQGRGRRPIPRRDAHRRARLAARDGVPAIDRRGGRLDDGAADPDLGLVALAIELFILGSALKRSVTGPLRRLVDATSSVASGRFDTRLDYGDGRDEISELARAFDGMSREVDARERALTERGESSRAPQRPPATRAGGAQEGGA